MQKGKNLKFLISKFRHVLSVALFLVGYSSASEFCADVSEHCPSS